MSAAKRIVLGIAALGAACWLALLAAGIYAYQHYGLIQVDVSEGGHGSQVAVTVPGALIHWGMSAAEVVDFGLPRHRWLDRTARAHERELVRALVEELAAAPDGVYVQIDTDGEHAYVAKRQGTVEIRVVDGDDRVRVAIPAALAERTLRFVARQAARSNTRILFDES